jgi:hypothetical protein
MSVDHDYSQHEIVERNILKIFSSTRHVFLFDHARFRSTVVSEIGEYDPIYQNVAQRSGYEFYEFEASQINERLVLEQILDATFVDSNETSDGNAEGKQDNTYFDRLCAVMKAGRTGAIGIHNAEFISDSGVAFLSRLGRYIKSHDLNWKILIFTDKPAMAKSIISQLGIDAFYSRSTLGPISTNDIKPDRKKSRQISRFDFILLILLGIVISFSLALILI